jgi:hypothetical protein
MTLRWFLAKPIPLFFQVIAILVIPQPW